MNHKRWAIPIILCFALCIARLIWLPEVVTKNDRDAWLIYVEEVNSEAKIFRLFADIDRLATESYTHPNEADSSVGQLSDFHIQSIDWWESQKLSGPDSHRLSAIDFHLHNAARHTTQACSELVSTRLCEGDENCIQTHSGYAVGQVRWARLEYYTALFLILDVERFYGRFSFFPIFDLGRGK